MGQPTLAARATQRKRYKTDSFPRPPTLSLLADRLLLDVETREVDARCPRDEHVEALDRDGDLGSVRVVSVVVAELRHVGKQNR